MDWITAIYAISLCVSGFLTLALFITGLSWDHNRWIALHLRAEGQALAQGIKDFYEARELPRDDLVAL